MKVRLVAPGRLPTGERRDSGFLTVGRDYVVLAILASTRGVRFLILDDRTQRPGWHSSERFDLVAADVPTTWRVQVGAAGIAGRVQIAPKAWLDPGFLDDYWGDDPDAARKAEAIFKSELEVIMRECD